MASLLAFVFVLTSFVGNLELHALTVSTDATTHVSRKITPSSFEYDPDHASHNQVRLDYTIEFDDIPVGDVTGDQKQKEIVLVIDTSGSMSNDVSYNNSRISVAKKSAKRFLEQLRNVPNAASTIKVNLINYDYYAELPNGSEMVPLTEDNYNSIIRDIDNLRANGGTNTGDGIRRAEYMLKGGNTNAEKYMVFLTDGEPTFYSYYLERDFFWYREVYQTYSGNPENYNSSNNYEKGLEYATLMAKHIYNNLSSYHGYYVSFSDSPENNRLDLIAEAGNGSYYEAKSENDMIDVYDVIAEDIITEVKYTDVRFEEELPIGVGAVELPDGMTQNGRVISKTFPNIIYRLNNDRTAYQADPIQFQVIATPDEPGIYNFGTNKSTSFHYKDASGDTKSFYFPVVTLDVSKEKDPYLHPKYELNVLDLESGYNNGTFSTSNFRLDEAKLQAQFPEYTINLIKMPMSQFVGSIDEVNGKYDIVFLGHKTQYLSSSIGKTSVNIDITSKKVRDLGTYIQSGQLFVAENGALSESGSKLNNELEPTVKGSNVHRMDGFNESQFYSQIFDWYKQANHRPNMTITTTPKLYDETEASYINNNMLSFKYSAYNEESSTMTLDLYLDLNGDGVYLKNEKVLTKELAENMNDYGFNHTLTEGFNGMMPWKLVLTNKQTGAKDYAVGYSAFKGVKSRSRVLQLAPKGYSWNLTNSGNMKKPLDTEHYDIDITYMKLQDYIQSYPNPHEGRPTKLNGNYDMVIFGFSDSYSNDDLKESRPDVIEELNQFIQTGQSVMFTHDTAGPQDFIHVDDKYNSQVNYNDAPVITGNFKDDMGFTNNRTDAGRGIWRAKTTNNAFKLNDGLITQYPYILADNGSLNLPISPTHDQYWQIDLEDETVVPWFTLNANNYKYYPENFYYTFTNGNITFSGTGHSPGGITKAIEEQELFVNTMIKASRGANHAPTLDVDGLIDGMNIQPTETTFTFGLTIHDVDEVDQSFDTEIVIVKEDGTRIVAKRIEGMEKERKTDITVDIPAAIKGSDKAFTIEVNVTDPRGAKGMEDYDVTHLAVPTLEVVAPVEEGYLVGDTIPVNYKVSTSKDEHKQYIKDIHLTATVDTDYVTVTSHTNSKGNGPTYVLNPDFAAGRVDYPFVLTAKKPLANTSETNVIGLSGDYDVIYSSGSVDNEMDKSYESYTNFKIREGNIKVEVVDNIGEGRPVEKASIRIYEGNTLVDSGETSSTGLYTSKSLKSGSYRVVLNGVPSYYSLGDSTEATIDLSYDNARPTHKFAVKDDRVPLIQVSYDRTPIIRSATPNKNITIHVKTDGVSTPLTVTAWKKLPAGQSTANASMFTGDNEVSNKTMTYEAVEDSPFGQAGGIGGSELTTLIDNIAKNQVKLESFEVKENGTYAIYARNSAGRTSTLVVRIGIIIERESDGI